MVKKKTLFLCIIKFKQKNFHGDFRKTIYGLYRHYQVLQKIDPFYCLFETMVLGNNGTQRNLSLKSNHNDL